MAENQTNARGDVEFSLPTNLESPSPAGGSQKDESPSKNRERDERIRLARERQKEEHKRKMEELREAMTRADEFRRKQEEERKRKIDEMRKREEEHRAIVEERRKKLLDEENERRQAILRRTAERETKVDLKRQVKPTTSGASPVAAMHGAVSVQDVLRLKPTSAMRSSRSVRDIGPSTMTVSISAPETERDSQIQGGRKSLPAAKKRLSVSIGHLAGPSKRRGEAATLSVAPSGDDQLLSLEANGSVSPVKGRARSMGNYRRSRTDVQKIVDHLATPKTVRGAEDHNASHAPVDKPIPKKALVTISKTSTATRPSVLATDVATAASGSSSSRVSKVSAVKPNGMDAKPAKTPPGKSMPPPPRNIMPRAIQKENKPTKESVANKPLTGKGMVKAVHDLITPQNGEKQKENSPEKEKDSENETEKEKIPEAASPVPLAAAEKSDPMKKSMTEADEYKSKLTENRRLAREKAEREAEEERLRLEELRRQEEERIRREEEEERLREEEELRLAAEARKREEERFRKAVEEEEMRKKKKVPTATLR